MKAKTTTKKTTKAAVKVKDIKPEANPVGGHHKSHPQSPNSGYIRKAS